MDLAGYSRVETIRSDNIVGLWYNAEERKLAIQFSRGLAYYVYSEVPPEVVTQAENCSDSLGSWVRQNITHGAVSYPFEKC